MAACVPLLKGPVERCMRKAGLPTTFGVPIKDLNPVQSEIEMSKGE